MGGEPELVEGVGGRLLVLAELLELVADFVHQAGDEADLQFDQAGDRLAEAREGRLTFFGHGAGDDQRGAGLVDQDGVDFVDDAEPVVALNLVLFARGHAVVAQVIEAEFRGGAVGDVATVHLTTQVGGHLLLDTTGGQAQEAEQVAHPLGVAAGEVVVDRDQLGVSANERV